MDKIRVLRIIEYIGDRGRVEEVVSKSIHGTKNVEKGLIIRATTIGSYPEILNAETNPEEKEKV